MLSQFSENGNIAFSALWHTGSVEDPEEVVGG